jgi:hypothetical protein
MASLVGVKATTTNAKKNLVATDFLELIALPDARSGY